MKKLFLATTAVFAFSAGSASAADLSRPALKAAPLAPPCAAAKFQGGYIGIQGGGVNWTANRTDLDGTTNFDGTLVQKKWGGTVGGQIGYNWTTCNTLWGIEVNGSWIGATARTRIQPNTHTGEVGVESKLDALVTGRVRTGVVLDNLLLYLTGGVAAAHTKTHWFHDDPPEFNPGFTVKDWRWGWVAGFGTEWAWSDRVSLKSEVLYVDLVDKEYRTTSFFTGSTDATSFKHSNSFWVSRVGLNVKLGAPPVVAKY